MDLYAGRDTLEAETAAAEVHRLHVFQIAFIEAHKKKK